jgi:hypothetical protein
MLERTSEFSELASLLPLNSGSIDHSEERNLFSQLRVVETWAACLFRLDGVP